MDGFALFSRPRRFTAVILLGLVAVGHPGSVHAQVDSAWISSSLSEWYSSASRSAPGEWGIAVADQTGRILWSVNPSQPMIPASTVKVFTSGFARSVLGAEARRSTRVMGRGRVDPATGEWIGDWWLQLNGDPTFERPNRSGPTILELARQLAVAGVRRLNGPLSVRSLDGPATATYPAVWADRHRGRLFAPPIGPVTLNENVVYLTVRPGERVGAKAELVETAPDGIESIVTLTATTRAGRRSRLKFRVREDGGWTISGTIGINARPQRLAAVATKPRLVLEAAWARALQKAGIIWVRERSNAASRPRGPDRVLAEVVSAPLDSVAAEVNRRSLNLGAELLLQWAGGRERGPERLERHVRAITGYNVQLVDGSGLSGHDRVAPATFVAYLARFPEPPAGQDFPQLLPANGTGTLRRLSTGLPESGVIRAKTGTLRHVSTVVGYLGRPDGVLLISLMYNGPKPWRARQEQWKLFRTLGADGVAVDLDPLEEAAQQYGGADEESRDPEPRTTPSRRTAPD